MYQRLLIIIFIALTLFTGSCKKDKTTETTTITVSGVDLKPNFFQLDGKIVGIDADIAAQAMQNAGISAEFNMASSPDEAYQAALAGPGQALLTLTYTAERKDLFKWAGPTSKSDYVILAKASSGVGVHISIEASKSIESIAAVEGWPETTILEDMGFNNLYYYNSFDDAIAAFKNDEVKAIASDMFQVIGSLSSEYFIQEQINPACIYYPVFYFIAFSKDVDDQVVSDCQSAIDAMKTNGTEFFDLFRGYVPFATPYMIPGLIQLTTEINPPFNYIASMSGAVVNLTTSLSYYIVLN